MSKVNLNKKGMIKIHDGTRHSQTQTQTQFYNLEHSINQSYWL